MRRHMAIISVIFMLLWVLPALGNADTAELDEIQKAIKDKGANWVAGITSVSHLTPDERRILCGDITELSYVPGERIPESEQEWSFIGQPPQFDWRNVGGLDYTTAIKSQGSCGSCVAFATVGVLEAMADITAQDASLNLDLSEQHLFSCGCGTNCCNTGWSRTTACGYLSNYGTPDEACFPYTAGGTGVNPPCGNTCSDWKCRIQKLYSWGAVPGSTPLTPAAIKAYLQQGPLVAGMAVYQDFFSYSSGVYQHVSGSLAGYHAIAIYGWDDTTTPACWICKNSWGTGWGESGWFRMRMGSDECGIESRGVHWMRTSYPITAGLKWLKQQQNANGSWTYVGRITEQNVGLTSIAAMCFLNYGFKETGTYAYPVLANALTWIRGKQQADNSITNGSYKIYDTALAILALIAAGDPCGPGSQVDRAVNYLISVQNVESNGIQPTNKYYGGWAYSGPSSGWADLSNTQFVMLGLWYAQNNGVSIPVSAWTKVETFLTRCQNKQSTNPPPYSFSNDGGFIYQPGSTTWGGGQSYGSMTAAGLWGLRTFGAPWTDSRINGTAGDPGAWDWFLANYSVSQNPPIGQYFLYYYLYCLAKACIMWSQNAVGPNDWYVDTRNQLILNKNLVNYSPSVNGWYWSGVPVNDEPSTVATGWSILALESKVPPPSGSGLIARTTGTLKSALTDLHLYDPENRHVGVNYNTGLVDLEIPGVTYSGPGTEPQEIYVPAPLAGAHRLEIVGKGTGQFTLGVFAVRESLETTPPESLSTDPPKPLGGSLGGYPQPPETLSFYTFPGEISEGEALSAQASVSRLMGPYTLDVNFPLDPPTGLICHPHVVDTSMELSWDRVHGANGYVVYYDLDGPGFPYFGMGASEGSSPIDVGNVDNFLLTGLELDTTYYFAVTAYDTLGRKSDYSDEASCILEFSTVLIPNTEECVNPGDYVSLPILLDNNTAPLGGFELEVEFDYTSMCFVSAERGDLLDVSYTDQDDVYWSWEYFTYRLLPCPIPPCQKYKILIYGQAEIPNGIMNRGLPIPMTDAAETLVFLNFVVMNNELLRGFKIPVCWEWEGVVVNDTLVEDWECSENTFSSASGDTLITSTLLCQFNPVICDLPTDRILPVMIFQDGICGQNCGGIDVCPAGPGLCKRGDVNMNTVTYEVADAVLFANYFVYGTSVFIHDMAYQICATDANADGRALTLSDLIYLIRVILHDAIEIPKLAPASEVANVIVANNTITTECAIPIGAILFEFDGPVVPTLLADMEMVHNEDKVLVWSREGQSIEAPAELISFAGDAELVKVTAVDRDGHELETSIVGKAVPISFALNPAYPNPFNPNTNISFTLPEATEYSLRIYNIAGRLVRGYVGMGSIGLNVITWDSKDQAGVEVASGVYFYKLAAGDFGATRKMVMLK